MSSIVIWKATVRALSAHTIPVALRLKVKRYSNSLSVLSDSGSVFTGLCDDSYFALTFLQRGRTLDRGGKQWLLVRSCAVFLLEEAAQVSVLEVRVVLEAVASHSVRADVTEPNEADD